MVADIIINIKFLTAAEGGRTAPIIDIYSCPLFIDNEGFDCRLLLNRQTIELGSYYRLKVKFLCIENILGKLAAGKEVFLWEGKFIARRSIVDVMNQSLGDAMG